MSSLIGPGKRYRQGMARSAGGPARAAGAAWATVPRNTLTYPDDTAITNGYNNRTK